MEETQEKEVEAMALLPPQFSPRSETLGGYIFVCNNETMHDCFRRQIFGLGYRYRDSVRAISPGTPLFLYNYHTGLLHGIFEATSSGAINIDTSAWPDPKNQGRSRYPAQVSVRLRKDCPPLTKEVFRPLVANLAGNRFRHELTVPEVTNVIEKFEDLHSYAAMLAKGIAESPVL